MIVTYNRIELTKQTLNSIFENTDCPYNLVVVDNNSTDGTLEYLYGACADEISERGFLKGFKIHRNEQNRGIAVGRNQALQLAEDEWLSTLDNDVLVPKGWLTQCIEILRDNPMYGMLGVNMEGVTYPLVKNGYYEWQDKPRGNLGTACTVFHRSLHQMLGYFNTEYGLYGEEDADFGMRVRVLGLKLGYLKEAGKHVGEGENDIGEYRDFKTASHKANLKKFNENCSSYISGKKSIYIPFKK
ncbi:MAG TPA: glycosyltransferase [Paenisporosarcina sp.]|nr:glycosyltransferase [Paenisporosarcina sp.]